MSSASLACPGRTTNYQPFKLFEQKFTFDVDFSQLHSGPNGAPCFSPMDADGGGMVSFHFSSLVSRVTRRDQVWIGYCDSQSPHDIKCIDGEACVYRRSKDIDTY
ncbi:glycoside hydrolase [Lentinula guzmanii]|uniref:Glucanase n=1 Tax=Lentinula guzmanii TaxID=2804957 RepID=A0AA38J797_9AGAR|nr:glycoside hydrolase [Lentinula guzmanii]